MICPKCGHEINYLELIDDFIEDSYNALYRGICHHCKTEYRWWEIYKFSHVDNLEEVK